MNSRSRPAVAGDAPDSTAMADQPDHWGRPRSWACIIIMIVGFAGAGVALTVGPAWPWVAAGIAVFAVGGVASIVLHVNRDSVIDDSHINAVHQGNRPVEPPVAPGSGTAGSTAPETH